MHKHSGLFRLLLLLWYTGNLGWLPICAHPRFLFLLHSLTWASRLACLFVRSCVHLIERNPRKYRKRQELAPSSPAASRASVSSRWLAASCRAESPPPMPRAFKARCGSTEVDMECLASTHSSCRLGCIWSRGCQLTEALNEGRC